MQRYLVVLLTLPLAGPLAAAPLGESEAAGWLIWALLAGLLFYAGYGLGRRRQGAALWAGSRPSGADATGTQALVARAEHLYATLESISEGVICTDMEGRVQYVNPVAGQLVGWSHAEALGKPLDEVVRLYDQHHRSLPDPVAACLRQDRDVTSVEEQSLRRRDGSAVPVAYTAVSLRNEAGRRLGAVLTFRDTSALQDMARQLVYQASHDSLTGLINRGEFESRLQQALARAGADLDHQDALCYLDLDQFKVVNDTCGHIAGDTLLAQLAGLLRDCLREQDVLARLGGDEFGVLLRDCSVADAERVADSLRRTLREFRFVWQERAFDVGVSIGLVMLDADCGSMADVLSAADSACYVAKDQGRNRIQRYQPDDGVVARHRSEMHWVQRVARAVEKDRLVLYGQSITPLQGDDQDGRRHVEILLRMLDEDGSLVSPMAFIPAAERFNIMPEVDRWVLRHTLALMAEQRPEQAPVDLACAVNLSGQSVCDPAFLQYVLEQIRYHGVPAANVCFEITETAAIANFTQAQRFLAEIRQLGCCFALDDFGSGLSSFGYLKKLPVDYLKIDGSFVRDMVDDPVDHAMVESINQLGHVMGMRTIAEYVENDAIRARLTELGVDYAQGFAVGGVLPLERLLAAS